MQDAFCEEEPQLVPCGGNYSFFFDLIEKESAGNNSAPLHRICTLMRKLKVTCFIKEELKLNQELEAERQALARRTEGDVQLQATRFTFFRTREPLRSWTETKNPELLGYAVLATIVLPTGEKKSYIVESVVRPPSVCLAEREYDLSNSYLHCSRQFSTIVGTETQHHRFTLCGSFFSQQNGLTHVCAHAALRIVINSCEFYGGNKVTAEEINRFLGITHELSRDGTKTRVGKYDEEKNNVGLNLLEMESFLRSKGLQPVLGDFLTDPNIDYAEFVYPLIESGFPVLLGIEAPIEWHVLAVVGHTLNTDRWTPEARNPYRLYPLSQYLPTTSWVDHFIVSDDNFGMYSTLQTDAIRNVLLPSHNPNPHAAYALGIAPAGVVLSGYLAELIALNSASRLIQSLEPTPDNKWLRLLQRKDHLLVCRSLYCSKQGYLEYLRQVTDKNNEKVSVTELDRLAQTLPAQLWVTELTLPNLYTGNKRKLGDAVCDATAGEEQIKNDETVKFTWLPGVSQIGPEVTGWSLFGHVPLIGTEGGCRPIDW